MIALDQAVSDEFDRCLASGDAAAAERIMAAHLRSRPASDFHIVLDLGITTDPREVATFVDDGIAAATRYLREIDPTGDPNFGAAYLEMNGFPENPDSWHFGFFAIAERGPPDSTSWLGDFFWSSEQSLLITGLEPLQAEYMKHRYASSYESMVAGQIVLARFQDLVARSVQHMRSLTMPLFASAHDGWVVFEAPRS
jgi:hypothetical protein